MLLVNIVYDMTLLKGGEDGFRKSQASELISQGSF